jgi:hypothetical protein
MRQMIETRLHARFQADGALRTEVIARAEAGTLPARALAGFLRLRATPKCAEPQGRWGPDRRTSGVMDASLAVERFCDCLILGKLPFFEEDARRELWGKNLACWCPATPPCHADLLLEIANA